LILHNKWWLLDPADNGELKFIVKSKVAILSQPADDCKVSIYIPEELKVIPFHSYSLQAT
tara:strand:+ start:491 stop:670 length:180 start_codon:yes stop_codon:yes gene_type:complete